MIQNPKYEANIFPDSSEDNEFYTVYTNDGTFKEFVENLKEELAQFDPEYQPYAIVFRELFCFNNSLIITEMYELTMPSILKFNLKLLGRRT